MILSFREIELPDDTDLPDEIDEPVEGFEEYSYLKYKLYEFELSDGNTVKFLLINYSEDDSDTNNGYMNVKVVGK